MSVPTHYLPAVFVSTNTLTAAAKAAAAAADTVTFDVIVCVCLLLTVQQSLPFTSEADRPSTDGFIDVLFGCTILQYLQISRPVRIDFR